MSHFAKAFGLAHNNRLNERVDVCMIKLAIAVLNEDAATPNHEARAKYAVEVINHRAVNDATMCVAVDTGILDRVTVGEVSSDAAADEITDELIEARLSAVWNALSGVG